MNTIILVTDKQYSDISFTVYGSTPEKARSKLDSLHLNVDEFNYLEVQDGKIFDLYIKRYKPKSYVQNDPVEFFHTMLKLARDNHTRIWHEKADLLISQTLLIENSLLDPAIMIFENREKMVRIGYNIFDPNRIVEMITNKPRPLNTTLFEEFEASRLEDRLDYIFLTIFEHCDARLRNWYVDGAGEGEIGDLYSLLKDDYINFCRVEYDASAPHGFKASNFRVILDGEEWDLLQNIPKRWLFENFESELKDGIGLYKNKLAIDKAKNSKRRKLNKEKKMLLIESARSKLTVEEQKAVGIHKK